MSLEHSGSTVDPQTLKTGPNSQALDPEHSTASKSDNKRSAVRLDPEKHEAMRSFVYLSYAREALENAAAANQYTHAVAASSSNRFSNHSYGMLMRSLMLSALVFIFVTLALTVNLIPAAHASSAGAGAALPYEVWLTALQKSATGPIAFTVSLLGIIGSGATLIFTGGEISRFMRSIIYIVLVMTLLLGANSLMTNFFNGASITPPAQGFKVQTEAKTASAAASHLDKKAASSADATSEADADSSAAAANLEAETDAPAPKAKKLKPSVFGKLPQEQGVADSIHSNSETRLDDDLLSFDEREVLDIFEDELLSLNPELTYEEHVQRFISGLLNESEAEAELRASRAKGHHPHIQPSSYAQEGKYVFTPVIRHASPSMFEKRVASRTSAAKVSTAQLSAAQTPATAPEARAISYRYITGNGTTIVSTFPLSEASAEEQLVLETIFDGNKVNAVTRVSHDMHLSAEIEPYNINSYQLSPLPLKNNAETLKSLQSGNAELELQLFEFSNRTLKGLLPSYLDQNDSRLS